LNHLLKQTPSRLPLSPEFLDVFEWLIVLVLLFLLVPLRLHGLLNPQDEGVWLSALQSNLTGQRLYSDIWFQYGPLLLFPVKAMMHWFGETLATVRIANGIMNMVGLLWIYIASRRLMTFRSHRLAVLVLVALGASAAHTPFIPFSIRYGAGFLSMAFWPKGQDGGNHPGSPWISGLLAGLACWISQEAGLAAFIAGVYVFHSSRRIPEVSLRPYLTGFLSILLAGAALLVWQGSLRSYVECSFLDIGRLVASRITSKPRLDSLDWQFLAKVGALYTPVVLYALLIIGRMTSASMAKLTDRVFLGILIYGAGLLPVAWARSDHFHIYFALPPALFLGGLLSDRLQKSSRALGTIAFTILIVWGGLLTVPPYLSHRRDEHAQSGHLRPVSLARAGRAQLPISQANGYEYLAEWLDLHTQPRAPLLFFPYNGALYFLANRTNACRFPILADAHSEVKQRQAIEDLEKTHPEWVIIDQDNTAFDGVPIQSYLQEIYEYVQTHYLPFETYGPFVFMHRRKAHESQQT
jgi:hypothetical protein